MKVQTDQFKLNVEFGNSKPNKGIIVLVSGIALFVLGVILCAATSGAGQVFGALSLIASIPCFAFAAKEMGIFNKIFKK
jgi:hypothetical protein